MTDRRPLIALIIAVVLLIIAAALWEYFAVEEVSITGNTQYTDEEIEDMILTGPLGHNSLYLYFRYNNRSVRDVPFIERMDVSIDSPTAVTINVYEKAIAGYVKYLGRYMYFDRDGIIVEASTEMLPDIPYVTGLDFDECVLYEPLPVQNEDIFSTILALTQLFDKYEIKPDRIYFDDSMNVTLYFGNARVLLGNMDNIDEKMMKLKSVLDSIKNLSGELHLENYSLDKDEGYVTFERDEQVLK
ncbi:MAG: FtsQ-type POTRA domain-containing protein [Lachnospiraceae bacterium]|nr:FtsQ-type POTRA domain-containing protein [Lachnospiraceae bacterium]